VPKEVKVTTVRFPVEVWRLLERLSERMSLSKLAVITTALRDLAKREGVE
jgi:predicted transcriptional regulator